MLIVNRTDSNVTAESLCVKRIGRVAYSIFPKPVTII